MTEQRPRQNGLSYIFSIIVLQCEKFSMKVLTDLLSVNIYFLADVSQPPYCVLVGAAALTGLLYIKSTKFIKDGLTLTS